MILLDFLSNKENFIKIIDEKRINPRFFVQNVFFETPKGTFKVKDLSTTGMLVENLKDEKIDGFLLIDQKRIIINAHCRHITKNFSGYEFSFESKEINDLINPQNIAQELCLYRTKNNNWLCFTDKKSNKMFFNFNDEKQTQQFFIKVNNSLIFWNENFGLGSGEILDSSKDLPEQWQIKEDSCLNLSQLKFCRDLILNNKNITQSFKDWVIDKFSN